MICKQCGYLQLNCPCLVKEFENKIENIIREIEIKERFEQRIKDYTNTMTRKNLAEEIVLTEEEFDFLVKHKKQICKNCNHYFVFHVNDGVFGTECVVCKCRNYEEGKCKK